MNRCRQRRLAVAWILAGENLDSGAARPSAVDYRVALPGRRMKNELPGHAFPDQPLHRRHHRLRAAAGRRDYCGSTAGFRPAASPPREPAPPRHQGRDLPTHLEEPHRLGRRTLQPHQDAAPGAGRRRHRAGLHPHHPPPRLPPGRAGRGARRRRGRLAACHRRRPHTIPATADNSSAARRSSAARHPAGKSLHRPPAGRVRDRRGRHRQDRARRRLRVVVRRRRRSGASVGPCAVHRALRHQRALPADPRGHAAPGRGDRRRQARQLPAAPSRRPGWRRCPGSATTRTAAGRCRGGHPATHAARAGPGPRSDVGRQADRPVARGPALERPLDARRHLLPGAPAGIGAPDGDRLLPPRRCPRTAPSRAGGQGSALPSTARAASWHWASSG